ncbi:MAG TPA: ABC transporter permease [Vicinamibacterales bacterium]|jgi:predicted permease
MFAESVARDVRIGVRVLVKEKAFCALAIFVLALGVCAVTTQFSVVNGIMLRGFSFPNGDRLTNVSFSDPSTATAFGTNNRVLSMDYQEMVPEQKSFELMTAFLNGSTVNITIDGQPRRYTGAYTSETFMRVLGVGPMLGRDFTAADNTPGAEKVALIGYGLWQRDFGGAASVVGKSVRINGKPATIIGVMPKGFVFPTVEELWIPLNSEFPVRPRNDPQANAPGVIGLIKRGVTLDTARAEMTAFAKRFATAYPDTSKTFTDGLVQPLLDTVTGPQLRGTLMTMLAFCVGVLLIACFNVMNMQFARATLRAKELAVRSSLGATRTRLIGQMLTESLLLACVGAAVGVGLAYLSVDWFATTLRNMDNPPPAWMTFDIDAKVLTFTVLATIVAAVVSGLLPAWMASRANVAGVLREGGRGNTNRAINLVTRGLVVTQIVVTCLLLIGSLLQLRSILAQQNIDYGYDTSGIMSARMGLMDGDYPTQAARKQFYDRLIRELRGASQFEAVAYSSRLRMVFSGSGPVEIEGKVYKNRRDRLNANFEQVNGSFFDVMGQRVIEGRTFTDDDLDSKLPVAIVNAAFARKHFGTESPMGRRFRTGDGSTPQYGPWRTIVGVVTTVRMQGPFNIPNVDDSGYYVPFYSIPFGPAQDEPAASQFATVLVKPHAGQRPETLLRELRRQVNKVDPNLPLYFTGTPAYNLDSAVAGPRIIAVMFTIFGIVAVILAAVGIYGVMSFSVNQRTQEYGVRMALGADYRRILTMVLKQGSRQLGLGLAIGIGLSVTIAALGRDAIATVLFGVSALDPLTFGFVAGLIALVGLVATLVPARRATRVDPMIALRAE